MNILDLLQQKGIDPGRRLSSTNGGEYHMPCPRCGGRDRFCAWPEQGEGGGWWCRNCEKGGDLVEFLRWCDDLSFPEACQRLGIERQRDYRRLPQPANSQAQQEVFRGTSRELPPAEWQARADKLSLAAHETLKARFANRDDGVVAWLHKRGLDIREVVVHRLGWLPGEGGKSAMWRPRSAWGLPDLRVEDKNGVTVKNKIWIPRGLLIPTISGGQVVSLRIRRPEADRQEGGSPYYVMPGGAGLPMTSVVPKVRAAGDVAVWVVPESQLDAILVSRAVNEII